MPQQTEYSKKDGEEKVNVVEEGYSYRNRIYQIILRPHQTIAEVLYGFDLPVCQAAWDGEKLYMTPEAKYIYETGIMFFDLKRAREAFEPRLFKFWNRGFSIYFPLIGQNRLSLERGGETVEFYRLGAGLMIMTLPDSNSVMGFDIEKIKAVSTYEFTGLNVLDPTCVSWYNMCVRDPNAKYSQIPANACIPHCFFSLKSVFYYETSHIKDTGHVLPPITKVGERLSDGAVTLYYQKAYMKFLGEELAPVKVMRMTCDADLLLDMRGISKKVEEKDFYHLYQ